AHEGFRNASDRLRTIDAIDDPRTRYTELDSFLTDARIEIEGQMHAFVEGHLFDFQEMGFGLNEDVSFRPDEDTISHITAALMDKSDKGGYETVNLEADGFLRENLYSQYLPLERSLIQLTQYQAYLRVEAMTRGLDQTQDTFLASNFDQARELSDQCKADNSSPALTPQLYNQTI
ncbi:MAG: hypothetical protein HRT94_03280, partial [Alphaproteobacteria bacterium]|nr:hypothetical protein [Alphaproteobacteria bacterium]